MIIHEMGYFFCDSAYNDVDIKEMKATEIIEKYKIKGIGFHYQSKCMNLRR